MGSERWLAILVLAGLIIPLQPSVSNAQDCSPHSFVKFGLTRGAQSTMPSVGGSLNYGRVIVSAQHSRSVTHEEAHQSEAALNARVYSSADSRASLCGKVGVLNGQSTKLVPAGSSRSSVGYTFGLSGVTLLYQREQWRIEAGGSAEALKETFKLEHATAGEPLETSEIEGGSTLWLMARRGLLMLVGRTVVSTGSAVLPKHELGIGIIF